MFYFCTVKRVIGLWCNGNTTDSGPVILGSNPGSPTKRLSFEGRFFVVWHSNVMRGEALRATAIVDT